MAIRSTDPMRLDANESIYFARELEFIKSASYDVKHSKLKALSLIPVSVEANRGASSITYRSFDMVGVAKIVADYAIDFPNVDVFGTETTIKVKSLGDSFEYTVEEIRASDMAGKRLDQRRALVAREAIDRLLDSIAWKGDDNTGLRGLINYPGISECEAGTGGTNVTKTWSTKTPLLIIADLAALVSAAPEATNGLEEADTIILPLASYNLLAYTPMSAENPKTILSYVRENFPKITTIDWVQELGTAGDAGDKRIMAYCKDPRHLTLEVTQPFELFPQPQIGMTFKTLCHAKTGGVIVYYPQSVTFMDGI